MTNGKRGLIHYEYLDCEQSVIAEGTLRVANLKAVSKKTEKQLRASTRWTYDLCAPVAILYLLSSTKLHVQGGFVHYIFFAILKRDLKFILK